MEIITKMDKREELKGMLKEIQQETLGNTIDELKAAAEASKEENIKLLEKNKELDEKLEKMQGKIITLNQNTGINTFKFVGYNGEMTKNFMINCSKEAGEVVAKEMIAACKAAYSSSNTGAYVIPNEYGTSLLGLAELRSVALSKARVLSVDAPVLYLPAKATRATVDAQAFGTANADAATTLGQITFTIDKRVGGYQEINENVLLDGFFNVVDEWVMPALAEAIGQNADDEMFNAGSEFTSSIGDVTDAVTASGSANIAAAITYDNLNTMYYHIEWERGLDGEWFGSRGALKSISALTDTYGQPIFQQVPINGRPSQMLMGATYNIVPKISNTPSNGAPRLIFGDPRQYIITVRGGNTPFVNPYIKMKEGVLQVGMYARMDGNVADNATASSSTAWAVMSRVDA